MKECPFRYPGQYEDVETGLYYNRFRYYSPEEGMYISQDPIGLKGGEKFYAYVNNSNILNDPLGLDCKLKNAKGQFRSPLTAVEEIESLPQFMGKTRVKL